MGEKPTKNKSQTTPKRVAVEDKRGQIARPLEKDIDIWLAAGWKRVDTN